MMMVQTRMALAGLLLLLFTGMFLDPRSSHPNVIPGARRFPRTTRHLSRIIL
jgi:hypothetical protein